MRITANSQTSGADRMVAIEEKDKVFACYWLIDWLFFYTTMFDVYDYNS